MVESLWDMSTGCFRFEMLSGVCKHVARQSRCRWLATILFVAVGCGGSQTSHVSGQVLRHDGTPLVGATVTARSNETGKWASGITDEEGRYRLQSPNNESGLPPGDYYVTIAEASHPGFDADQQPPRTIPQKYEMPSSGLELAVKAGEPTVFDVRLDPLR
jgi:hypothetical protein